LEESTLPTYLMDVPPPFIDAGLSNGVGVEIGTLASMRSSQMDIDLGYSAEPSSTISTPTPPLLARNSFAYYPSSTPSTPTTHPHHIVGQRHHPYAHPNRPTAPLLPHSTSASGLPVYFTPVSSNGSSPSVLSPELLQPSPVLSNFPGSAPIPQRVHSAPQFIEGLLPNPLIDGMKSSGLAPIHTKNSAGAMMNANMNRDWEGDRRMMEQQQQNIKLEDYNAPPPASVTSLPAGSTATGYFDPPSTMLYHSSQPSTPSSAVEKKEMGVIPAIALVRNRLPILEAALSASVNAPGDDEEQIWKGVESAYEELKRVIVGRMESRRRVEIPRDESKVSSQQSDALSRQSLTYRFAESTAILYSGRSGTFTRC
jgi:hypothetical protein